MVFDRASTQSSDPVRQSARMCRKRGRIVLVGVTGLELSRADFYEKELTFRYRVLTVRALTIQIEEKGRDYPLGYRTRTEQRNFEAVLEICPKTARCDAPDLASFSDSGSKPGVRCHTGN